MKFYRPLATWAATLVFLAIRLTCRIRRHDDPRPQLQAQSQPYVYSVLHAHQVATIMGAERGTGAMVSNSRDGAMLIPALRLCGVVPIRGSSNSRGRDRGGRAAFQGLVEHIAGGSPAYLAVDGPRGPRNRTHKGVALLSMKTGAPVINVCAIPTRRWILARAWDRMQVPKPFATVNVYFGEPIVHREGESAEQFRARIEASLSALEYKHDPSEAERTSPVLTRAA